MNASGRYRILKRLEMVERLACLGLVDWKFPVPFAFNELPEDVQNDLLKGIEESDHGSMIASIDYSMTPFPMSYLVEQLGKSEKFIKTHLFDSCMLDYKKNQLIKARALRLLANLVVHFEIYRFVLNTAKESDEVLPKGFGKEIGKRRRKMVDSARLLSIEISQYASYIEKLIEAVRIYVAPDMYLRDEGEMLPSNKGELSDEPEYANALLTSETILTEIDEFKTNYLTPLEQLEAEMLQTWKLEDLPPLLIQGKLPDELRLHFITIMARLFDRFHLCVDPSEMMDARDNFFKGVFEIVEGKNYSTRVINGLVKQAKLPGRRS